MARGDFPSAKQDQYMLRFPDGMRDTLKSEAEKNGRSMNAEIVARLAETLNATDTPEHQLSTIEALVQENLILRKKLDRWMPLLAQMTPREMHYLRDRAMLSEGILDGASIVEHVDFRPIVNTGRVLLTVLPKPSMPKGQSEITEP